MSKNRCGGVGSYAAFFISAKAKSLIALAFLTRMIAKILSKN